MEIPSDECVDFLRGVRNDEFFDGRNFTHSSLSSDFHNHDSDELKDWQVTSINWDLPSGGALRQLLTQTRKNGELQFKFGAIRIPRKDLDDLAKRWNNKIGYEIRPENENEYHGHILLSKDLDRPRRQTICAHLLFAIPTIHRQENQEVE